MASRFSFLSSVLLLFACLLAELLLPANLKTSHCSSALFFVSLSWLLGRHDERKYTLSACSFPLFFNAARQVLQNLKSTTKKHKKRLTLLFCQEEATVFKSFFFMVFFSFKV
jgi:hypothetical protein